MCRGPVGMTRLEASNIIVALALAGIPMSVLIARWRVRGPLRMERARLLTDSRRATCGLF